MSLSGDPDSKFPERKKLASPQLKNPDQIKPLAKQQDDPKPKDEFPLQKSALDVPEKLKKPDQIKPIGKQDDQKPKDQFPLQKAGVSITNDEPENPNIQPFTQEDQAKPLETSQIQPLETSSLYKPSKTLENTSMYLQTNPRKIQIVDQNTKKVNKAFTIILLGDDKSLSLPRAKFLYELIPESYLPNLKNQYTEVQINDAFFVESSEKYFFVSKHKENPMKSFVPKRNKKSLEENTEESKDESKTKGKVKKIAQKNKFARNQVNKPKEEDPQSQNASKFLKSEDNAAKALNPSENPNEIPDKFESSLLALPVKHLFPNNLQVLFMLEPIALSGDQVLTREDAGLVWFCESNNQNSLDFLKKEYQKYFTSHAMVMGLPSICVIVIEKEQKEAENKGFQKDLEEFCKVMKTNPLKINFKNLKSLYEKFKKFLTGYLADIQAENKERVSKLKENVNQNPKFDRFFLNEMAFFFTANQGIIPLEILEKRVYLTMGRPNDLLLSQFRKNLEPLLEKYKVLFQKSNEENINKPPKSKAIRPVRRNPLVDEKGFAGKLILTESEAKELVRDYCEFSHFNSLKSSKKLNKEGLLRNPLKEAKSSMHINIDGKFKAFLGFPSTEDFQEIKDFLEKNAAKIKEVFSQEYEEIITRRHKALKPKPLYKTFDPLKRDFHGQEISKLVSKENLDLLAEFLVKKNPFEDPDSHNLKLLTGFIGLKESKHLDKKITRITQEMNEMKNKQKISINAIESIKEKLKTDEIIGNLQKIRTDACFEDWGLIYLKSCKASQDAIASLQSKNPKLMKKIGPMSGNKKIVRVNLFEYEENNKDFIKKMGKIKRVMLLISEETPSSVETLRKFLETELLRPKKSHSLQKLQLLILFFTLPNTPVLESFEAFLRSFCENLNVSLQEESLLSMKSYFEYQFFDKLAKHYEKQTNKPKDYSEESKPSLQGIIPQTKTPSITYENFLEMLSGRLFPGEPLNRDLMDELFRNWFFKHENNFDVIDFNKLYQKALKKINKIIEILSGKINSFHKKEKELQESLQRHQDSQENQENEEFIAVKIEEFAGIHENLVKKRRFMLEIHYGSEKTLTNKLNLSKSLVVNEKFLLQCLQSEDFLIKLVAFEEKSPLDGVVFSLKLKDLKPEEFLLGTIKETVLNPETTDPELKSISMKLRYKRLAYSKEKALIKIRKFEAILKNFNDYLTQIYRYKYELLEVFSAKSSDNAEFLTNHLSFLENLQVSKPNKEPVKEIPGYEEDLQFITQELETQKSQIKALENQQNNCNAQKEALERDIKKLQEESQALKEENTKEKASLETEIQRKTKALDDFLNSQKLYTEKIKALAGTMENIQRKLGQKEKEKQVILDKRGEIVAFFTAGKNAGYPEEKLRKLQEYFLYLQKSILKFYNKAVIIEADVFEMKTSTIKAGLGCLAGSVPFLGNLLKFVVEAAIEIKKKWDEHKFVRKCLKFSTLIHSQRILAEISEEAAFEVIKDPKKQELILEASEMKTSTLEMLKKKLIEFFNKAKDFFTRKKKNKTQEKLLKDLDTPAKLLGNIDGGYLCTQAVELYKEEHMTFNPEDPYNKKGLVQLFKTIILNIDNKLYEKVIGFEEMKDFKGVLEVSEEALKEKIGGGLSEIEPSHEEIKAAALEDPGTVKKMEEMNEDLVIFRDKQEKNEKKLLELIEEHNLQHIDLESHEKRLNALEKQAILGLNYLGGLNQEVSDVRERVENLYSSMNVKYQEILKKLEEGGKVEENLKGSGLLKKLSKAESEKFDRNDQFFMYLEKTHLIKGVSSSSVKTPKKQLLTPLTKKQ